MVHQLKTKFLFYVIRPETEAAWPSEDVSKLGGFPGRSPRLLVDMQSAMEEKNKRLICLKEAPLKEEELEIRETRLRLVEYASTSTS